MKGRFSPLGFAVREIIRNKVFTILFIVNLSFGLSGIAFIEQFKAVFTNLMQERSLAILGSDLAINSRFKIEQDVVSDILAVLPEGTQTVSLEGLFSMARGLGGEKPGELARLVSLTTIDKGYPFYGNIILEKSRSAPKPGLLAPDQNSVWVYPELLNMLGANIGEKIAIGKGEFTISDVVVEDPGQTMRMAGIAPKIFISPQGLARAELIGEGSTVRYATYFKLPESESANRLAWGKQIEAKLSGTDLRVVTPTKASEQLARGLDYLSDFLGLVSLVALFLASVGLFYLYRSYLASKRRELAILNFLGLKNQQIVKTFSLHLCLLGTIGTALSLLLINFLFPPIIDVINGMLPFELSSSLGVRAIISTVTVGLGGTLLLCLPLILPLTQTKAIDLLRDKIGARSVLSVKRAMLFLPWVLFCYGLALWMANSFRVGSLFMGLIALVALLLFPLGSLFLRYLASHLGGEIRLSVRLAIGYLSRFRFATLSLFFALSLSTLLLHLIPQLEGNLKREFLAPEGVGLPSLFLFDIQEEQKGPFEEMVQKEGASVRLMSPMVRARLTKVRGEPYRRGNDDQVDQTREEQEETRVRNRGLNLSYRSHLDASETIIDGRPFDGSYQEGKGPVEVSLEKRWAQRIGAGVGDPLTFEVFGMEIEGVVVNIRHVRWTSFVPNFFVVLQPGVLEDAPKTYLAALNEMDKAKKDSFQAQLFKGFANVSAIDVSQIIDRMLSIMGQMALALKIMSVLSLVVGLLVLYSLVNHQMRERARDLVLLKVLGGSSRLIKASVRWQLFMLSGFSAVFALALSSAVVWILARELFEGLQTFNIYLTIIIGLTVVILSLVVGEISARKWLALRAREALQEA